MTKEPKIRQYLNAPKNDGTRTERWEVDALLPSGERKKKNFKTESEAKRYAFNLAQKQAQNRIEIADTKDADQALAILKHAEGAAKGKTLTFIVKWFDKYYKEPSTDSPDISTLAAEYLDVQKKKGIRPRSLKDCENRLAAFTTIFGARTPSEILTNDIQTYLSQWKGLTFRNHRTILSGFFAYLCGENRRTPNPKPVSTENPVRHIPPPQIDEFDRTIFSQREIKAILKKAYQEKCLFPYWVLSLFAGIRDDEYSRFAARGWDLIDLESSVINIPGEVAKKRKRRQITIEPNLKSILSHIKQKKMPLITPAHKRKLTDFRRGLKFSGTDLARHTAISYKLKIRNSFIDVATEMGNSEAVIRAHYQNRVTETQAGWFWGLDMKAIRSLSKKQSPASRRKAK